MLPLSHLEVKLGQKHGPHNYTSMYCCVLECYLKIVSQHKHKLPACCLSVAACGRDSMKQREKADPSGWINFHSKQPQLTSLRKLRVHLHVYESSSPLLPTSFFLIRPSVQ